MYSSVNAVLVPLNLLIAWYLTELGVQYLVATIIGFSVQITFAFFINRAWTFKTPEVKTWSGLARASLVEISALLVVLVTVGVAVEFLQAEFLWARIAGVITSGIWCYVLDSVFTFRTYSLKK